MGEKRKEKKKRGIDLTLFDLIGRKKEKKKKRKEEENKKKRRKEKKKKRKEEEKKKRKKEEKKKRKKDYLMSPLILRASRRSLGIIVTRFA